MSRDTISVLISQLLLTKLTIISVLGLKGTGAQQAARVAHLSQTGRAGGGGHTMAIKQEQGVESLPETPGEQNDSFCGGTFVDSTTFPGVEQVSTLVASSIFEAHQRTCLLTIEQIKEQWELGVEQSKVEDFMRMVRLHPLVQTHD